MNNKKSRNILKNLPSSGLKVSLNGNGERLHIFFSSEQQFEVARELHEFDFENPYKFNRDNTMVEVNGTFVPFSEQSSDLAANSNFRDAKVLTITTKDKIKYNFR